MLADLAKMGFSIQDPDPPGPHRHRRTPLLAPRGEHATGLEDLRGLLPAIRAAGEKGLTITRFKGLGEMNAEELRDTTLDPANRTLLQVTMDDAGAADDLFRILMGDKVEPRREFIEKHALEVRNLDVCSGLTIAASSIPRTIALQDEDKNQPISPPTLGLPSQP